MNPSHEKSQRTGGGYINTYNISERIAYWLQLFEKTGNPLFKKQADRLELERQRNNATLQKKALNEQPKLFPDEQIGLQSGRVNKNGTTRDQG